MSFARPRDSIIIKDSPEPEPYIPRHLRLQSNANGYAIQQFGGVGDQIDRTGVNGQQNAVHNEFSFGNSLLAGQTGASQPWPMTVVASRAASTAQTVASSNVSLPQYSGSVSRPILTSRVPAITSENDWRFGLTALDAPSRPNLTSRFPPIVLPTPTSENDWRFGLTPLDAPPRPLESPAIPVLYQYALPTSGSHAAQPSINPLGQSSTVQLATIHKGPSHTNPNSIFTRAISHGEVVTGAPSNRSENHVPLDLKENTPNGPIALAITTASKAEAAYRHIPAFPSPFPSPFFQDTMPPVTNSNAKAIGNPAPPREPLGNITNNSELPFAVLHLLVNTIQKLLEQNLFDFAKRWAPQLLKVAGWEVPEQGELNTWTRRLDRYIGDITFAFRANGVTVSYHDFSAMLVRLHHLRHAAVHRNPVKTLELKRWMVDAVDMTDCLAKCLKEFRCYNKLRVIEFGVWQPHNVRLEEVATKPLDEFTEGHGVPDRSSFVDPTTAANIRRGVRPPQPPRRQPRQPRHVRRAMEPPRRSPSPQPRRGKKRSRSATQPLSPDPQCATPRRSKRLKKTATAPKQTQKKITHIDLTEDTEEGEVKENGEKKNDGKAKSNGGTTNNTVTQCAVVIDLTED